MNKKSRKVTFVTPTKSPMRNVTGSPTKKLVPVTISSLKTRGLQKMLDYVKKVEADNARMKQRERRLREKLEKCRDRKNRDKERFDEAITEMATRIFTEQARHNKVIDIKLLLFNTNVDKIDIIHLI